MKFLWRSSVPDFSVCFSELRTEFDAVLFGLLELAKHFAEPLGIVRGKFQTDLNGVTVRAIYLRGLKAQDQ